MYSLQSITHMSLVQAALEGFPSLSTLSNSSLRIKAFMAG